MATSEVELIVNQVKNISGKISDRDKLNLIQRIAEVLQKNSEVAQLNTSEPAYLIYGEFYNPEKMSTEEDFKLTEYNFNEDEWK
jgi:hypothetical protein